MPHQLFLWEKRNKFYVSDILSARSLNEITRLIMNNELVFTVIFHAPLNHISCSVVELLHTSPCSAIIAPSRMHPVSAARNHALHQTRVVARATEHSRGPDKSSLTAAERPCMQRGEYNPTFTSGGVRPRVHSQLHAQLVAQLCVFRLHKYACRWVDGLSQYTVLFVAGYN